MSGITVSSFQWITHQRQQAAFFQTTKRQEQLLYAFASFVMRNGRLPRPSVMVDGIESADSSTIQVGIVPYKTLGLNVQAVKDGHNHWFTYIVDGRLTVTQTCYDRLRMFSDNQVFCRIRLVPGIEVVNEKTINLARPAGSMDAYIDIKPDPIVLSLISHGPLGGYWCDDTNGSIVRKSIHSNNAAKIQNAGVLGGASKVVVTQAPLSRSFDDQVVFITRDHLIAMYGQQPCGN